MNGSESVRKGVIHSRKKNRSSRPSPETKEIRLKATIVTSYKLRCHWKETNQCCMAPEKT